MQSCAHVEWPKNFVEGFIGASGSGFSTVEMQGVLELLMLEGVCWNPGRLSEHRSSANRGNGGQ